VLKYSIKPSEEIKNLEISAKMIKDLPGNNYRSSDENERIREETKTRDVEEEYKSILEEYSEAREGLHFHVCSNCGEYECPDDALCYSEEKQDYYECRNN
jgi:hypothetical protein